MKISTIVHDKYKLLIDLLMLPVNIGPLIKELFVAELQNPPVVVRKMRTFLAMLEIALILCLNHASPKYLLVELHEGGYT